MSSNNSIFRRYQKTIRMNDNKMLGYIKDVLENMPSDWLRLTTHRLDIYNESLAKTEFLDQFAALYANNNSNTTALAELPTAFDYIRLGHPLSSILELTVAKMHDLESEGVVSFSSNTTPVLSILRKNLLENKQTRIMYTGDLPDTFDSKVLHEIYGYNFELLEAGTDAIAPFNGSTIFLAHQADLFNINLNDNIDFFISAHPHLGSILLVNGSQNLSYVGEIQHVRRRETIAMTPANCLAALQLLVRSIDSVSGDSSYSDNKTSVHESIKEITGANSKAVVGSSGLSIQYAIAMGLIHDAMEKHPNKDIKFIVPPNCYGGTNDQARRVAACIERVSVMDLPVDGGNDMVQSIDTVLEEIAKMDAVPYIIAEIPTNPRVEVPDLIQLENALSKERKTANGEPAIDPVFILDQTFCPNVLFLSDDKILSSVRTISYVSGSKFPSGGLCTAGYCVANSKASELMEKIDLHIKLCDNEATSLQMELLAKQLPSMNERIEGAYLNTREFVNFIGETLPEAKINFVSEALAEEGFRPSVFSLDLPTKGDTPEARESYKRALNDKLITMMITQIPNESKYCVSYGQLKGCYWTIPATSTQGTTKEEDKDYIARVALSKDMDLEMHKKVFVDFVAEI